MHWGEGILGSDSNNNMSSSNFTTGGNSSSSFATGNPSSTTTPEVISLDSDSEEDEKPVAGMVAESANLLNTNQNLQKDVHNTVTKSDSVKIEELGKTKRHFANMIYTPPSYSDHIMVSMFVPDEVLAKLPVKGPTKISAQETAATRPWRNKTMSLLNLNSGLGEGGGKKRKVG